MGTSSELLLDELQTLEEPHILSKLETWLPTAYGRQISLLKQAKIVNAFIETVAQGVTHSNDTSGMLCAAILALHTGLIDGAAPDIAFSCEETEDIISEFLQFATSVDGAIEERRESDALEEPVPLDDSLLNELNIDPEGGEQLARFLDNLESLLAAENEGYLLEEHRRNIVSTFLLLVASGRSESIPLRISSALAILRSDYAPEILGITPDAFQALQHALDSPSLLEETVLPGNGESNSNTDDFILTGGWRQQRHNQVRNTDQEGVSCAICQDCQEGTVDMEFLICGHSFHRECAEIWLSRNSVCPLCNTPHSVTEASRPARS